MATLSDLLKAGKPKKKINWHQHAEPKPRPPVGFYEGYMPLVDCMVQVPSPFISRLFLVDASISLELLSHFELPGITDKTILEQHLYPAARYAQCLKKHYYEQPFPVFYLTEETHHRLWFHDSQPAFRDHRGQIQFRKKLHKEYPPFTLSDESIQQIKHLSNRLKAQGLYYKKMSREWFFD